MDAPHFDQLVRTLAAGRDSRRGLLTRAARALVGGRGVTGVPAAAREHPTTDKGNGKGNSPACRGEGHPCEGNQVCCAGLVCTPSGPGAAARCTAPAAASPCSSCGSSAVAVAAYRVQVHCAYAAAADQTTCTCTGIAPPSAPAVRSVAVTTAAVCAEVVGGNATLAASGSAVATGFTTPAGAGTLTLVLAGQVEVSGSATWWCTTAAGTVPATGPGLVRVQHDVSATTGAVEVRALACATAAPPSGFDWYGKCTTPKASVRFALAATSGAGAAAQQATTGADGRCRFGGLQPGTYHLTQPGATWCHAESDGVDQQGNLTVQAGHQVTVWIFDCPAAK